MVGIYFHSNYKFQFLVGHVLVLYFMTRVITSHVYEFENLSNFDGLTLSLIICIISY